MPYIIGAVVVLFLIIVALCTKRDIKNNIYVCPKCKKRFKPLNRKHSYFGNMSNDSEVLKCPNCKKIGICSLSHDQNEL